MPTSEEQEALYSLITNSCRLVARVISDRANYKARNQLHDIGGQCSSFFPTPLPVAPRIDVSVRVLWDPLDPEWGHKRPILHPALACHLDGRAVARQPRPAVFAHVGHAH